MSRRWVVNASPLIVLGKLSLIHLLPELAETLVIPAAVALEVNQGPEADPARQPFLNQVVKVGLHVSPEVLAAVRRLAGEDE